jgi:hypothetical protein
MRLLLVAESTLDSVAGGSEEADAAVMLLLVTRVSDAVLVLLPAILRYCRGNVYLVGGQI